MSKRAERRHHAERLKNKRLKRVLSSWHNMVDQIFERNITPGKLRDTPTPCSCNWCGNPRKWYGEKPYQERRDTQDLD